MKLIPRFSRLMTSAALLMLLGTAGCSKPPDMRDQRLAEFARESMTEQRKQNDRIADQAQAVVEESSQLAEAAKEMVKHDAEARRELITAQRELNVQLNKQRSSVDSQRDRLEQERRDIALHRHRDPLIAAAIQNAGLIIACLLPLIVCALVIRQMSRSDPDDAAVAELLVHELTTDRPRLLPGPSLRPPALEHQADRDERSDTSPSDQPAESDLRS